MRRALRQIAKIVFIAAPVAYFFPKLFIIYAICGLYDVSRNEERTADLFKRYFLGNGAPAFLLSPVNALLDLLSLPYVNRGVYRLGDLPEGHQHEILRLIEAAKSRNLVPRLEQAAAAGDRSMFFFKWYGTNVETVAEVPEFHEEYRYITTIGVSVFNRKQSTSKHFGPLRATLRVLYNLDDVLDDTAYIAVGRMRQYWRDEKLFIFDDTLLHQSFNESDRVRYNLFVDIVRPTSFPGLFKTFVQTIGLFMSKDANRLFYARWNVLKKPQGS